MKLGVFAAAVGLALLALEALPPAAGILTGSTFSEDPSYSCFCSGSSVNVLSPSSYG